jgi:hypothetical protein
MLSAQVLQFVTTTPTMTRKSAGFKATSESLSESGDSQSIFVTTLADLFDDNHPSLTNRSTRSSSSVSVEDLKALALQKRMREQTTHLETQTPHTLIQQFKSAQERLTDAHL